MPTPTRVVTRRPASVAFVTFPHMDLDIAPSVWWQGELRHSSLGVDVMMFVSIRSGGG